MLTEQPLLNHLFYKHVLESLEDYGVLTTTLEGVITSWNKGAEHILGYSEEEVCGKTARIIFTDEDCKNGVPEHEFSEALVKGRGVDERFHQKKDGTLFWASGLIFPLCNEEAKQIGFTKILRNLSERKEAQEAVDEANSYALGLVDTSKEPIVILNPDLTINSGSKAFFLLFELNAADALNSNLFKALKGKIDLDSFKLQMQKEESVTGLELTYPGSEKADDRILMVSMRKVFPTVKSIGHFLITFDDITTQRKLERAKDEFIGIASHELKTPLTSLTVAIQLLEAQTENHEELKLLHALSTKAAKQVDKLTYLVHDLMDVTKIQSGQMALVKSSFPIRDLVKDCIEEVSTVSKGIAITLLGDEGLIVYADKRRLTQVVTNLLTNAIKYSPGTDKIEVSISDQQTEVCVSVRDFGVGIEAAKIPFVFDRFFRAQEASYGGLGLGLYISAEIVHAHKGKMSLKSIVGAGSTFSFTIPHLP